MRTAEEIIAAREKELRSRVILTDKQQDFCEGLRSAIRQSGLKSSEIAEEIGVGPNTISFWIHGHATPNIENLCKFARITGTTLNFLCTPYLDGSE